MIIFLQLPSLHPTQTSALWLLYSVVPAQGNCAMNSHVYSNPTVVQCTTYATVRGNSPSKKPGYHVLSSQQPLLVFFLATPVCRSPKEVEKLMIMHVVEDPFFQGGGHNQESKVPLNSCPVFLDRELGLFIRTAVLFFSCFFPPVLQIFIVVQS